ncbi:amino acid adenylation domain-containing protein [Amycolatopsis xylanica]|uniref:Amino acid adenylation domain-containing protein n=1 Tax=Amycolatopsis xylanica TaxID=589385 RepID=A0A1H3SBB6_9PSEU|nr:amino acid adenylation domain-containing protein [Amycolatopsis xylanica]SDZ35393.1 amino acid adenylation domain-containing protein [Amycolatopsis xylanica]
MENLPLGRLPMWPGTTTKAVGQALRNPKVLSGGGVFERVNEIAEADPDAVAVVDGARVMTYRQLSERVRRLRLVLRGRGCRPGDLVGVAGPRSAELIAAFLAIESLGAAYLPVDPGWPAGQLADMARTARPRCVLVIGDSPPPPTPVVRPPAADAPMSPAEPARRAPADEPRYVIHTSGSTGRPKGVVVAQSGLLNHLWSMVHELELGPSDSVAFTAAPSYVISIWQMLAALLVGGRVVVIPEGDAVFGRRLVTALSRGGVTVAELVPTAIGWLAEEHRRRPETAQLPSLRCLVSTGEKLSPGLAARVLRDRRGIRLVNAYGATECADDVTLHRVTPADCAAERLPIGVPLPNVALYLLVLEDGAWRAAEPGEPGELWVGGAGVACGYHGEPELTRGAFFVDEFDPDSPTGRLYRTGDFAVFSENRVYCLGRADRQVKVAGVRIELDEVEAAVAAVPGVAGCAVVVQGEDGDVHLHAYYGAEPSVPPERVRGAVELRLPKAMVPRHWTRLDSLPLNSSGKVDYRGVGGRTGAIDQRETV